VALRTIVSFEAQYPADDDWDEDGGLLVPGGKGVLSHIRTALEAKGIVCSEPEQHSYFGWAMEAPYRGIHIWCLLQFADPWVLVMEVRWSLTDWLFRRKHESEHLEFLRAVHEILTSNQHFSSIRWFTKEEHVAGHSGHLECVGP
jgi:hypothetical protein